MHHEFSFAEEKTMKNFSMRNHKIPTNRDMIIEHPTINIFTAFNYNPCARLLTHCFRFFSSLPLQKNILFILLALSSIIHPRHPNRDQQNNAADDGEQKLITEPSSAITKATTAHLSFFFFIKALDLNAFESR